MRESNELRWERIKQRLAMFIPCRFHGVLAVVHPPEREGEEDWFTWWEWREHTFWQRRRPLR